MSHGTEWSGTIGQITSSTTGTITITYTDSSSDAPSARTPIKSISNFPRLSGCKKCKSTDYLIVIGLVEGRAKKVLECEKCGAIVSAGLTIILAEKWNQYHGIHKNMGVRSWRPR